MTLQDVFDQFEDYLNKKRGMSSFYHLCKYHNKDQVKQDIGIDPCEAYKEHEQQAMKFNEFTREKISEFDSELLKIPEI